MVTVIGPRDKSQDDYVINVTSRSKTWSRGLSPFFLGPIKLYGNHIAQNVENGWQYSKVYAQHADENQNPTDEYWEWAKSGWDNERAVRYPMAKGSKPLYCLWNNEKLGYIESKRKVYVPLYSNAVKDTEEFSKLKKLYKTFGKLRLWDFDAYNHRALGLNWEDVMSCETKKYGHGMVLAMLLEGYL